VAVEKKLVEDGIGQCGVADTAVPFSHWQLARDDSGFAAVTVFHGF